jgi:hypothetical protein
LIEGILHGIRAGTEIADMVIGGIYGSTQLNGCGQGAGTIDRVVPAAELVARRLGHEHSAAITRLAT